MTTTLKKTDPYAFTNSCEMGPPCWVDPHTIPLDVWRRVIDLNTHEVTGYCKRERMRILGEVFRDLVRRIDLVCCEKCSWHRKRKGCRDWDAKCLKCGADTYHFIDEYFHGPDTPNAPVPHDYRWIACYPVTGGNEGHYVHIEFASPVEELTAYLPECPNDFGEAVRLVKLAGREPVWKITRLALGKTFRGMDHAAAMANRCAKLLGA